MQKIAVLMSTYNGEKYLREQIDSILKQEGDLDISIIVRDDGSSDGTKGILDEYKDKGKLCWYSGPNMGPAGSFIDLVKKDPGFDYYAFADQDDVWCSDKLSRAVEKIGADTPFVYCANARLVGPSLEYLGRSVYKSAPATDLSTLSIAGGILGCTMVFNDALAKIIRDHDAPSKMVMHDFLVCELCLAVGGKVIFDDHDSINYRQHGNNTVGVSRGLAGKVKERLKDITTKAKVSTAEQASELLRIYGSLIPEENRAWLQRVSCYRDSFGKRLSLALTGKTKYASKNSAFKLRGALLFGNR